MKKIYNYLIFVLCAVISAVLTAKSFGDEPNSNAGCAVMFGLMAIQHAILHATEDGRKNETQNPK